MALAYIFTISLMSALIEAAEFSYLLLYSSYCGLLFWLKNTEKSQPYTDTQLKMGGIINSFFR